MRKMSVYSRYVLTPKRRTIGAFPRANQWQMFPHDDGLDIGWGTWAYKTETILKTHVVEYCVCVSDSPADSNAMTTSRPKTAEA